ncbi:hypothetical protein BAE44_0024415, partial [Dichanthelium oligosanthes]
LCLAIPIFCSHLTFSFGFFSCFLPKLHTLVLTNNRLTNLADIDPLASLPKLQYLSLLDNTVTKQPDYRFYVIHKLKHLRLLDFKKVKQQLSNTPNERFAAAQKFHEKEAEEEAKKVPAKTFTPGQLADAQDTTNDVQGPKVVAPTPEQITAIKVFAQYYELLLRILTLEEVARLEKLMSYGFVLMLLAVLSCYHVLIASLWTIVVRH